MGGMCENICAEEHPDLPECQDVCMCIMAQNGMCDEGDDACESSLVQGCLEESGVAMGSGRLRRGSWKLRRRMITSTVEQKAKINNYEAV